MADVTPTLRRWPGPNPVPDAPSGLQVYDPPALGKWKGLEFLAASCDSSGGRSIAKISPPYVPGQIVHDMGRAGETHVIKTVWIGTGWKARMENFHVVVSSQASSGELALPDGGEVLTAHVETWQMPRVYEDARDSGELTITFVEDSQVDATLIYAASPTEGAIKEIPASDTATAARVEGFRTVSADPDSTDEEVAASYQEASTAIDDAEAGLDLDTVEGCDAEEGYERSRGLMVESLDDPTILQA